MRMLLRFTRSAEFQNFVRDIVSILNEFDKELRGYVQGILLDYHRDWRNVQKLQRYGDGFVTEYLERRPAGGNFIEDILSARVDYDEFEPHEYSLFEETLQLPASPAWDQYAGKFGKKFPFVAIIRVLPTTSATLPIRRRLVDLTTRHPFFAIVEDRPQAVLAGNVQGGVDVRATFSGMLGGFLTDGNTCCGLTCGHVATTVGGPVDVDDVGAMRLVGAGTVSASNYGQLGGQPAPQFCNPFAAPLPEVDAALITLDSSHTALNTVFRVGRIVSVKTRPSLSPGQTVRMRGVMSGVHDYEIGPLVAAHHYYRNGMYYCLQNLFAIKGKIPAWSSFVNPRLGQPTAPRPRQGASGAWVCALERTTGGVNEYSFCGTLTAVDGDTGYVTFSDSFTNWSGRNLVPF